MSHSPLIIWLVGSLLLCIAVLLVLRWRKVFRLARNDESSRNDTDKDSRGFVGKMDVVAINVLTILFVVLAAQYIAIVYAFTFTLNQTDTETGDDSTVIMFDFEDDGDLDYVALNVDAISTADFEVHTFAAGGYTSGPRFGDSLGAGGGVAGDIDGDGDVDIVNIADYEQTIEKQVNIGGGSFTSYNIGTALPNSTNIILLDVDNDGDLDIITMGISPQNQPLWLNDGHGNFTVANSPLPAAKFIAPADFDSDGDLDLAIVTGGGVRIYKNSGTGAFIELSNISALTSMNGGAAGDYDNDGDIDLVLFDTAAGGTNDIYRATNNGTATSFSVPASISSGKSGLRAMEMVDVNTDGNLDVIATSSVFVNDGGAIVLTGNGLGSFTNAGTFGVTENTHTFTYGDIDGDSDVDVIHGNFGQNVTYLNDQSTLTANTAPSAPSSLTGAIQPRTPKSGATFVSDSSVGTVLWTNTGNAAASDGASVNTGSMGPSDITHYLKATNFRFTIPTNATIHGFKVDVERAFAGSCTITDNAVRLVKGGSIQSTDRSIVNPWPAFNSYVSYGGPSDLWGTTWTASDVNASNFGFAISAQCTGGSGGATIDHLRITVFYSAADVTLSWGSGSDAMTPTRLLQYQVRVGTGSSAHNIMSSKTASTQWISRIMPNGQGRMLQLKNLPCRSGLTYYWTVKTVDSGLMSTSASEETFSLDDYCTFSLSGGGGGGPPSTPPSEGGGLPASYFRQDSEATDASPGNGLLKVLAFNDLDGNGEKSDREEKKFSGLAITASGRTIEDIIVKKTLMIAENGEIAFDLPPSDNRGYWVIANTGSDVLRGYEATTATASGGYVLESGTTKNVSFGFRRSELLRYKPCLTIGQAMSDEKESSDAEILMQRLEDSFGKKMMRSSDIGGGLVSRKDFFTMLQRTQCIDMIRDQETLEITNEESEKKMGISLPLIDVPADATKADAVLMYSLFAAGADVGRKTSNGMAADLKSPITREEAVRAIKSILQIPEEKMNTTGVLPKDIESKDPIAIDFLSLQNLGALPESFQPIFGRNQGVDSEEAVLLIVRTAFRSGKISLLPEPINVKALKNATYKPTFLAKLPLLQERSCLEKETYRESAVTFSDVLPGDKFYADLRELLSYGTQNTQQKMLWLFAGTRRPTEFGITKGEANVRLNEPVSLLEMVRNMLILGCTPPDAAIDVLSGRTQKDSRQGSGESRVARDRISDLPRNATFASRVLYKSQDHQKEFDLSLFTYAPDFLRRETRSPGSGLSIGEASDILASTLLMIHVQSRTMSPQEAETLFESLSADISRELLGKEIEWRDEAILRSTPFTRHMLIEFLSIATSGRLSVSSVPRTPSVPLGEAWWELVR